MPSPTLDTAPSDLLGRDHPLDVLRGELHRTSTSHGGLVLVTGEAGIGKTSLVTDTLRRAGTDAIVASGATWDGGGAPGYWPWVQVLRGLERAASEQEWRTATGAAGEHLRFLLGGGDAPRADAADTAAFRLFDAVTTLLATLSRARPVVVVVEDLHWADPASLRLLEFVVHHAWFERVLVIASYRDVEVDTPDHQLRTLLPALLPKATTLTLTGLDRDEVAQLIARATGRQPDEDVVDEVHRRSGGNPFFVEQLASLWHSGGSIAAIPPGIRETLERRLRQLSATAIDVLTTAALLGRRFSADVLARVTSLDPTHVRNALDQAVAGRLLVPDGDGHHGFTHDLVRETLELALDEDDRRRRHADIVDALEQLANGQAGFVTQLAHHAYLAVPVIAAERAVQHLVAAAAHACRRLAVEEVVEHHRRALELNPESDPARHVEMSLEYGMALHAAGDLEAARDTFQRQVVAARELQDARLFARAVFGLHELGMPDPDVDAPREADLIDEARRRLGDAGAADDDPLRVQMLAAWSRVRAHVYPHDDDADDASRTAVDLARAGRDQETLGFTLLARHDVIWRPGTAPERHTLAGEMTSLARRTGDTMLELQASLLMMVALLELGDPGGVEELATFTTMADRYRIPRFRYLARSRHAMLAAMQGRFGDARVAADDALALGEQLGEVDRDRLWLEQRWAIALLQGDLDEAERLVARARLLGQDTALVPEAVTAASSGDRRRAADHVAAIDAASRDYPGLFQAQLLHARARLALATDDAERRATLRDELTPLRELWAVGAGGGTVYGPYAYWLARIDAADQRWDAALEGFAAAAAAAGRLGAHAWRVEARLGTAMARLGRADRDDAVPLLRDVVAEARELALRGAQQRAQAALEDLSGGTDRRHAPATSPSSSPPATTAEAPTAADADGAPESQPRFRPDGEVWELAFEGRTVRMRATKGLRDLHVLLSNPCAEVAATDLLDPEGGEVVRASRRMGGDPILDDAARAAYRRRLSELDEQIERATARHDDERAAELDTERETLLDELRSATGLAGRPRRLGDEAERARKTVTARIRDTLRRLNEQHPELAEHLRATVSTGATCRYAPSRTVDWQL